ncbi:MAG: hypothetical protein ACFFC7_05705 [Candidatus Hermodarchaeota archaeon]
MSFRRNLTKFVSTRWIAAVVMFVLLAGCSIYLSLYTQAATPVMDYVWEDSRTGDLYWHAQFPGTFFPFPHVEIPEMIIPVVLPPISMNPIDQIIYRYFLTTGLIFDIMLIWWISTICYGLLFVILVVDKGLKTLQKARLTNEDKKIN